MTALPEPRLADPLADFDTYQLVILIRPPNPSDVDDATAELIQRQHLGHLANMRDQGHVITTGPLLRPPESDPAVKAGRLAIEVMTWVTPTGELPTHD